MANETVSNTFFSSHFPLVHESNRPWKVVNGSYCMGFVQHNSWCHLLVRVEVCKRFIDTYKSSYVSFFFLHLSFLLVAIFWMKLSDIHVYILCGLLLHIMILQIQSIYLVIQKYNSNSILLLAIFNLNWWFMDLSIFCFIVLLAIFNPNWWFMDIFLGILFMLVAQYKWEHKILRTLVVHTSGHSTKMMHRSFPQKSHPQKSHDM